MRSRDLRNPPPGQFADRCGRPWLFPAPDPKAGRAVRARAVPAPSYLRRPPLADRVLPPGVSHAGR
jgi:broad specificity phosphatase PhoE